MLFQGFDGRHKVSSCPTHHWVDQVIDFALASLQVEVLKKMFNSPRVIRRSYRGEDVDGDLSHAMIPSVLCHGVDVQQHAN